MEAAKSLCTLSAPLDDPPPQYMVKHDAVMAWQDVSFGLHAWQLPRSRVVHPDPAIRARAFAAALLDGTVLPTMAGTIPGTVPMHPPCSADHFPQGGSTIATRRICWKEKHVSILTSLFQHTYLTLYI